MMEIFNKDDTYHFITIHCNTILETPSLEGWFQHIEPYIDTDKPYIFAYEHRPHLHLHALVAFKNKVVPQNWRNILTRNYKLSGKHVKGKSYTKQYDHRISKNPTNCAAYILKQQNDLTKVYSNLTMEQLEWLKSQSYEKNIDTKKEFKDNMVSYVDGANLKYRQGFNPPEYRHFTKTECIKYWIIKYLMEHNSSITRSKVDNLHLYYRQYTERECNQFTPEQFLNHIYNY